MNRTNLHSNFLFFFLKGIPGDREGQAGADPPQAVSAPTPPLPIAAGAAATTTTPTTPSTGGKYYSEYVTIVKMLS